LVSLCPILRMFSVLHNILPTPTAVAYCSNKGWILTFKMSKLPYHINLYNIGPGNSCWYHYRRVKWLLKSNQVDKLIDNVLVRNYRVDKLINNFGVKRCWVEKLTSNLEVNCNSNYGFYLKIVHFIN